MEKLQAALDKAREKRNLAGGTAPARAKGTPQRAPGREAADAAFAEIKMIKPKKPKLLRNRIISFDSNNEATPYDFFRTKVLQMTQANNWKRVAITSPSPGCGKTTTSANLAASFSRLKDTRVILMDMDMRRPKLAKVFGHMGSHSVTSILRGKVSFAEQARRISDNVAVSLNYSATSDPAELFLRESTGEILDEIQQTYLPDLMLFDMPPFLTNDDTSAFLRHVDCAVIIAEAETTTVQQIDYCEKELAENTNILGTVLNKCRLQDVSQGYYGRYY